MQPQDFTEEPRLALSEDPLGLGFCASLVQMFFVFFFFSGFHLPDKRNVQTFFSRRFLVRRFLRPFLRRCLVRRFFFDVLALEK